MIEVWQALPCRRGFEVAYRLDARLSPTEERRLRSYVLDCASHTGVFEALLTGSSDGAVHFTLRDPSGQLLDIRIELDYPLGLPN